MADWIDETLIDPETHLVFDGIKGGSLVRAQYTYCQGVVVGLETELAARTADDGPATHRFLSSGDVGWFADLGSRLLGPELSAAELVTFD